MKKRFLLPALLATVWSYNAAAIPVDPDTLISFEDFETSASGWTNNTTTIGNESFTTFLGRFGGTGGNEAVSKTFALSGDQDRVTIEFDFYEIDSWDQEAFMVFVNNNLYSAVTYRHQDRNEPGTVSGLAVTNLLPEAGNYNLGFSHWEDQTYHYRFDYYTTATSITLGFGSTLNGSIYNESWGIDNVRITDNSPPVRQVPIPSPLILFSLGLVALSHRKLHSQ